MTTRATAQHRTARRDHTCVDCGRTITTGTRYLGAGRDARCPYPCAHIYQEGLMTENDPTEDTPEDTPTDNEDTPEDLNEALNEDTAEDLDEDVDDEEPSGLSPHFRSWHQRRADAAWRRAVASGPLKVTQVRPADKAVITYRDDFGLHHEELVPLYRARAAVAAHSKGGAQARAYDLHGNLVAGSGAWLVGGKAARRRGSW